MSNSKRMDTIMRNMPDQVEAYSTKLAFDEMAQTTPTLADMLLEQLEEKQQRTETNDLKNEITNIRLQTRNVIDSFLGFKEYKRVKKSTIDTYRKRFNQFERAFPWLPDKIESILDYLNRFDRGTGRNKRNHHEVINMLYKHAVRNFNLHSNPFEVIDRPIVTKRQIRTLSLEQVLAIDTTPNSLTERVCLDLLLGHGWRQIEVRRILVEDVLNIMDGMIWCRGKERDELAPILPDTEQRLRELTQGQNEKKSVILASRTYLGKREPLGEDGISQLVSRLYGRAKITGMTGHDLRRSFATLVRFASGDELLATRLIRDKVPGQNDRYINFPQDKLRDALMQYSPVHLIHQQKTSPTTHVGPVNISGGDGGESNSPSRRSDPEYATSLVSSFILPG